MVCFIAFGCTMAAKCSQQKQQLRWNPADYQMCSSHIYTRCDAMQCDAFIILLCWVQCREKYTRKFDGTIKTDCKERLTQRPWKTLLLKSIDKKRQTQLNTLWICAVRQQERERERLHLAKHIYNIISSDWIGYDSVFIVSPVCVCVRVFFNFFCVAVWFFSILYSISASLFLSIVWFPFPYRKIKCLYNFNENEHTVSCCRCLEVDFIFHVLQFVGSILSTWRVISFSVAVLFFFFVSSKKHAWRQCENS